jgi:hypothetical protein
MTTCRGTWNDERVPNAPGLVLTLAHASPLRAMVMHYATDRCPCAEPHEMQACGEFDAPRVGFEPDPEPLGPWPRPRLKYDWSGWGE